MSVSLNTDDTVYQGTELIITCTVTVDSAVDTAFHVNLTWSIDPPETMDGSYVTITETSGSGHVFTSTVTISPVDITDSASYTCTASITPNITDNDYVISSTESRDTVNVEVKGEKL